MYNIFPNKKPKKESKKVKEKIIVDFREKPSLVPTKLIKENLEIEFKELPVGDYIVKGVAIERKSTNDFFASIFDRRIFSQAKELSQYKKRLIIIEGNLKRENRIHENALRGTILSLSLNYSIPIIFSKDEKETARFINLIAKKENKETSLNPKKYSLSEKEELQFILEGFPKIGPKKAKALLKKFRSLEEIFNSNEKELGEILGKNSAEFKRTLKKQYMD